MSARALAGLNHPNIPTIYDVGTHEGTPYVVSELLEGETMRELVSHRSPTERQIFCFAVQIARGLLRVVYLKHNDDVLVDRLN